MTLDEHEMISRVIIGQQIEDVIDTLSNRGYDYRTECADGKSFMLTQDIRPDRINLTISGGIVTGVSFG